MLLKVVAFTWDVGNNFTLVGQTDLCNLTQSRVRLFRGRCVNAGTNAALLWVLVHRRDLGLDLLRFTALADQLVNRGHEKTSPWMVALPDHGEGFGHPHRSRESRKSGRPFAILPQSTMPHYLYELKTLHPEPNAPGYFDGLHDMSESPIRNSVQNPERPRQSGKFRQSGPDMRTGNVQL
jgi:hypothetical protein